METRRSRASTTIEPPSSWGGFLKKASPSSSPSSSPSPPSTAPPPLSLSSRTTSMAVMRPSLASSDPVHRRAASSLTSSIDSSSMKSLSIHTSSHVSDSGSASSPLLLSTSVPSPRSTMPASAFAGLQLPKSSKGKGFTQTIVEFIRSPRTSTPKVVTTPAPSPYVSSANVNMETAIFGVELETAVRRSNRIHELLPDVVYKCLIYLHDKGPQEEGIFRLTGSVAEIKKIREVFDEGRDYDINSCLNPHTVAGILKLFIRESPQRLIPTSWSWSEVRPMQELHDMVKQLGPPNRCFLSCLIRLLRIVSLASGVTKMGVSNLVIVFSAALQCTGSFLTHLINHAADLFPLDELVQTRQRVEAEKKVKQEKEKFEKEEQSRNDNVLKERAQKEKAETERAEKEKIEKEKLERELAEKERAEEERAEKERAEKERAEKERAENELAEKHRIEKLRTEKELSDQQRENDDRDKDEYTEKKIEDKYTIRAKLDRKKQREHEHKKKEKRDVERKRGKKEKQEKRREEDVPLFEDEKELEQENAWTAHMEQYEKEEEQRKINRETKTKEKEIEKIETTEQSKGKDDFLYVSNNHAVTKGQETQEHKEESEKSENNFSEKDGRDGKDTEESDRPKTLTVEIRNQSSLYDEDDLFKEEDERKVWELDVGDRKEESTTEKRKIKKRMQTIFDSDDDE